MSETSSDVVLSTSATPEVIKTATFVKHQTSRSGADQRLYRVSPEVTWGGWSDDVAANRSDHVVVSAVVAYSGPETFIFPADENGKVIDFGELQGSFQGGLDHNEALRGSGYEVIQ
jgi:hypothetical protein